MGRTIIALALALALPACGDGTEAKLDRCKAEMKADLQRAIDMARQEAEKQTKELSKLSDPLVKHAKDQLAKMHKDMLKSVEDTGPVLEAQMKTWQGANGLATCEKMLAVSRETRKLFQP